MAPQQLTEYERRRLENMKRNDEVMASLKLQSKALNLSSFSSTKRNRLETKKVYKTPEKKPKSETPIVIRRSLRARGIPPDVKTANGLEEDTVQSPVETPNTQKFSPRNLGHFTMQDAYFGECSMKCLTELIMDMRDNAPLGRYGKREVEGNGVLELGNSLLGGSSEREVEEVGGSVKNEGDGNGGLVKEVLDDAPFPGSIKREGKGSGGSIKEMWDRAAMRGLAKREVEGNGISVKKMLGDASVRGLVKKEVKGNGFSLNLGLMELKEENVARVMPGRILNVKFFPCVDKRLVVAGNKTGDIVFWDADREETEDEDNGIYLYHPHSAPISGISVQPFSLPKVISSCYDGLIR